MSASALRFDLLALPPPIQSHIFSFCSRSTVNAVSRAFDTVIHVGLYRKWEEDIEDFLDELVLSIRLDLPANRNAGGAIAIKVQQCLCKISLEKEEQRWEEASAYYDSDGGYEDALSNDVWAGDLALAYARIGDFRRGYELLESAPSAIEAYAKFSVLAMKSGERDKGFRILRTAFEKLNNEKSEEACASGAISVAIAAAKWGVERSRIVKVLDFGSQKTERIDTDRYDYDDHFYEEHVAEAGRLKSLAEKIQQTRVQLGLIQEGALAVEGTRERAIEPRPLSAAKALRETTHEEKHLKALLRNAKREIACGRQDAAIEALEQARSLTGSGGDKMARLYGKLGLPEKTGGWKEWGRYLSPISPRSSLYEMCCNPPSRHYDVRLKPYTLEVLGREDLRNL